MYKLTLRLIFSSCIFCMLSLQSVHSQQQNTQPVIKFGVVPQQAASKLASVWAPILEYLSQQTGYKIVFSTAPDIPTFESRLLAGEYDIAYMNPYHYANYSIKPGYRAFAHQAEKKIKGIIVVPSNSNVNSLNDLSGKTLAFPSPAAFAASMLPRANLQKDNVKFTAKYVGSHDSVYRAVAKGLYSAGGGIERTLFSLDPSIRDQLTILWISPGYTPHAFASHPRLSKEMVNNIADKMFTMNKSEDGKKLLSMLRFSAIQKAKDSDWDDIRFLDIVEYDWLLKSGK